MYGAGLDPPNLLRRRGCSHHESVREDHHDSHRKEVEISFLFGRRISGWGVLWAGKVDNNRV